MATFWINSSSSDYVVKNSANRTNAARLEEKTEREKAGAQWNEGCLACLDVSNRERLPISWVYKGWDERVSIGIQSCSMDMKSFQNSITQSGLSFPLTPSNDSCAMKFFIKKFQGSQSKVKGKGPSTLHLFQPFPWSLRRWSLKWGLGILNQVLLCKFNEMQTNT